MLELPELTPEHFEIPVVRELRKVGLEVSELRKHRRTTLPEPERGYLLELEGVISRAAWRLRALIGCRCQKGAVAPAAVESFKEHVTQAGAAAGILFATGEFPPDTLEAARVGAVLLLRVTDGRTAFDTS